MALVFDFFLTGVWTLLWAALICAALLYADHHARRRRRRHYGITADWPERRPANDHARRISQ